MSEAKIGLVEVFRSPQGEGYNTGRQAIFVRFAGCNLSCVFADGALCDTPYQKAKHKVTVDELFKELMSPLYLPHELRGNRDERLMLVLTGGEPTMSPQFDTIVRRANRLQFYVAVETNGTCWTDGLLGATWICVSPKTLVRQGSPAPLHNHNPQSTMVDPRVRDLLAQREGARCQGEYRYVIGSRDAPTPPFHPAFRHYVSPAVLSDGSGEEWKTGFPGFVPGAVERCLEICDADPRWRVSIQTHKLIGVR